MIQILSGTNRPDSRSLKVSQIIDQLYKNSGEQSEILDLCDLPWKDLDGGQYSDNKPPALLPFLDKIEKAEGLVVVVPEYNGSYPGALKYFIDHWSYPKAYECRPVCFVGLGGRFGGLRPVEHLQQVFGYRNSFVFPQRVFIHNVWDVLSPLGVNDSLIDELLRQQVIGFCKFIKALKSQGLDANSLTASVQQKP